MSFYRQQLENFLSTMEVKADSVYDLGGKANPVKKRVKKWEVKKYRILDLPKYNLNLKWEKSPESAEVVFCLEVFEYIFNPVQAMQNLASLMARGSRAWVTFAFVYPVHNEVHLDSLRYTETGVKRLADASGLRIKAIWYRRDKSDLLQAFYRSDGMRAASGFDHSTTGYIVELTK